MKEKLNQAGGVLLTAVVIGGLVWAAMHSSSTSSYGGGRYEEYGVEDPPSASEVAADHWDEVRPYVSGTETIEACSDSGCYSLDAEISGGTIETVYFPNGGYIYPDAEISDDGSADGYGSDDRYWTFQVDMDSSLIQDAITDWYSDYKTEERDPPDYR